MREADPVDILLGTKSNTPIQAATPENGTLHAEFRIMGNVMASDMEAELGVLFENC